VTLPPTVGPGRWYVLGRADDLGQVAETVDVNNVRFAIVEVGPDLVVYSFIAPSSVTAGSMVTVTDTIWNFGAGAATPSITRYYLSLNGALDGSDIPLAGERTVPGLAPNTNNTGSVQVQIPAGLSGAYYLLFVADGGGAVSEANETNNVRARFLTINP
jgi:subtilase family serine protease